MAQYMVQYLKNNKKTRLTEEGYPEGDQKLFTAFLKDNDKVL